MISNCSFIILRIFGLFVILCYLTKLFQFPHYHLIVRLSRMIRCLQLFHFAFPFLHLLPFNILHQSLLPLFVTLLSHLILLEFIPPLLAIIIIPYLICLLFFLIILMFSIIFLGFLIIVIFIFFIFTFSLILLF